MFVNQKSISRRLRGKAKRKRSATRPHRHTFFETLEARLALAAFTPGNILVSNSPFGQQSMLYEYSPTGAQIQAIPIVQPVNAVTEQARGVVLDANGNAQIFNGSLNPRLTTYNTATSTFSNATFPNWDTSLQSTFGSITAIGNSVFVTDQQLGGEALSDRGLIRFDINNLSSAWTVGFDANIGDSTGNTSTKIPHITVHGVGAGTIAYYTVTVTTANSKGIFDIDKGNTGLAGSFNSSLAILDSQGNQLATDLNGSAITAGAGGSTSTGDAYLEYTFATPGSYIVEVGSDLLGAIPTGSTYDLNISLQNHPLFIPGGNAQMNEVLPNNTLVTAQSTDAAIRFGSNDGDPINVTAGLDGKLYVLESSVGATIGGTTIKAYDPNTLQLLKTITLPQSYRSIAVDQLGLIYAGGTTIDRYNQNGNFLGTLPNANVGGLISSIDVTAGGELVAGNSNGTVIVSNTSLDGSLSFPTRASNGTSFVTLVQPPLSFPQATDESFSVLEDSQGSTLPVTLNDLVDSRGQLTVTALGTPDHGGTVSIVGNKAVRYTPPQFFFGVEKFTYTISDGLGDTGTGTVSVNVSQVNHNPKAIPDGFTVLEDSGATSFDVLSNDTTLPDVGEVLSVTSVGPSTKGGTVSITNGQVQYTPKMFFSGTDTFPYTISDGNGGVATSSVTVTVTHVNHNPTATNETFNVAPNSNQLTLDVLSGDSIFPDTNETLTVTNVGTPSQGGIASVTTGGVSITYQPQNGFLGLETFTYSINDGNGGTATGTVTVNVSPIIPPPTIVNDVYNVRTNSTNVSLAVLANDSTLPAVNQVLTITAVSTPDSGGVVTISSNGLSVLYTPGPNFMGTEHFTYTATESAGTFATATVTVNVGNFNQAPIAGADTVQVSQNSTNNVLNVLKNDSDPDGDPITIASVTAGNQGGTVTLAADSLSLIYSPPHGFLGTETFSYAVIDTFGGSTIGNVTIHVQGWQNPSNPLDVGGTGEKNPTSHDALLIINQLNLPVGSRIQDVNGLLPPAPQFPPAFYDVNGDGYLTAIDVLLVVNAINSLTGSAQAAVASAAAVSASVLDAGAGLGTSPSATGLVTGLSPAVTPAAQSTAGTASSIPATNSLIPATIPAAPATNGSDSNDLESILSAIAPDISRPN